MTGSSSGAGSGGLHRVLGMADGVGTSLSTMAPTFTIGVSLGSLAVILGPHMVIMWAIAILPMMAIALGFIALNAKNPRLGTTYTWARDYLHPVAGFMAGWITVAGFTVFLGYGVQAAGSIFFQVLHSLGWVSTSFTEKQVPAAILGVGILLGLCWLAVRGVDIAAKFQKIVITVDVVAVLVICATALIKGGGAAIELDWFNPFSVPSFQAFVSGIVAVSYLYWGWDNALRLNEESKDGGRHAGRAGLYSLLVIVAVFVFCQVGFQHATTHKELVEQGANGLVYVAEGIAGGFGGFVASVALLLSIFAVVQAVILAVSRQALAMGRDGVISPVWARLHPRHGTPVIGTAITAVVVIAIVILNVSLGTLTQIISGALIALGMLATTYYVICALAIVGAFNGERRTTGDYVQTLILPALAALALAAITVYAFVHNWTDGGPLEFDATSGRFQDLEAIGLVLLGLPIMAWSILKRRPTYFTTDGEYVDPELVGLDDIELSDAGA
jgi:amino acid transporter